MSPVHSLASVTANPLIVFTRLLLGLFFVWLGLTKLIPGWASFEGDAVALLGGLTHGTIDSQLALYVLGGVQVITGLTLCIVPAINLAVILLWLLLALYGALVVTQLPAMLDDKHLPTVFAQMILRNILLTIAALAVASHTIRVSAPKTASTAK